MESKPFKSLDELCNLLIVDRGLACDDSTDLKSFLTRTNYYRFSGYAREFQVNPRYGDNRFVAGTRLDDIRDIVLVDAEMRSLLMKQIAVVEVALRSVLAHEYAKAYGDSAFYLNLDFYKQGSGLQEDKPSAIISGFLNDLERDKSKMVSRYINSSANVAR